MPFKRDVCIGRVVLANYGEDYGKLYTIVDVVDQNAALVDRPDEVRKVLSFKRMALTDFKLDIPRLVKKTLLKKALSDADVYKKFASSAWGKKLARQEAKKNMTDFDRFQAMVKKVKRSRAIRKALGVTKPKAVAKK